jgi:hypothetical protein
LCHISVLTETTDRLQTVVILINIVLLSLCHIGVLTETTDRLQTVVILIKSGLLSLCHISVLTGNHWQASNCGDINQHCFIIFLYHHSLKPVSGFLLRHWCGTKIIIRFWLISPQFEAGQWFLLRHRCGTKIIKQCWLISPQFEACQWFPVKTLMWHKDNNTLLINFIIVWSLSVVSCQDIDVAQR